MIHPNSRPSPHTHECPAPDRRGLRRVHEPLAICNLDSCSLLPFAIFSSIFISFLSFSRVRSLVEKLLGLCPFHTNTHTIWPVNFPQRCVTAFPAAWEFTKLSKLIENTRNNTHVKREHFENDFLTARTPFSLLNNIFVRFCNKRLTPKFTHNFAQK